MKIFLALGKSRRAGEDRIPPYPNLFLTHLIQIKKNVFSKRALFRETSDPQTLYFSKLGLGKWNWNNL